MKLRGKQIAILGAGSSGLAAAALAVREGAVVTAYDNGDADRLAAAVSSFAALGVNLYTANEALAPEGQFDLTVISPGIDLAWPIARTFADCSAELIGEIEFAWRFCDAPVIAITGTNGKTTTTTLIDEVIRAAGLKSVAAGNIGLPFSEVVLSGEHYDWIVLEVSSFQLETIVRFAPSIAIWMNFAPDHLDRYADLEAYRQAKLRIFLNRPASQLAIVKLEDELALDGPVTTFSAYREDGSWFYREGGILENRENGRRFSFGSCELLGKHNAENVMVALAVAERLGLDWGRVEDCITRFLPPAHRCEKVGEVDGVRYVNDSKSTNLHSLASALSGQVSPVVLIAGGKDKGLNFRELREMVSQRVRAVVCLGEIREHLMESWGDQLPCYPVVSLSEAVSKARELAAPGDIVLFSPGTSSFDMFSGYAARGDAFREAVTTLSKSV
jgi:UDP-N-acetylmuramoylalanine--D-glutamate ligase